MSPTTSSPVTVPLTINTLPPEINRDEIERSLNKDFSDISHCKCILLFKVPNLAVTS